jgi:cell division septation protein DedD
MSMTAKRPSGQYELVLENRQLVFIFFGAVMLCAIFFALGFLVGREQRDLGWRAGTGTLDGSGPADTGTKSAAKKAGVATNAATPKSTDQDAINKELTFYKTVEGKSAPGDYGVKTPANASSTSASKQAPPQPSPSQSSPPQAAPAPAPAPSAPPTGARPGTPMIIYQVAALSKSLEAEALARKLKEKGFQAFIVSPSAGSGGDKLYRVQIGPFSDPAIAEQVKAQLVASGYAPITRK